MTHILKNNYFDLGERDLILGKDFKMGNFEQKLYICLLPSPMRIHPEPMWSGIFANGLDDNKNNLDIVLII